MIKQIQFFALLLSFGTSVIAGTIVEIQDKDERTTVMTDGKQARMGVKTDDYVLVNYSNNSVKFVSPEDREVILLDADGMSAGGTAPTVKTSVNNLGPGPMIAGYKTQKFSYSANGKPCGTIYGSKEAYKAKGIKELFSAMKVMMEKQRAIMGGFAGMVDDCTQADMNVSDYVSTIGVPMRTERNGSVQSEIKSIKVDVSLPADAFSIPAGYKTVTMQEKMMGASGGMAKPGQKQQQPQMQDMMRQMQQSGQITPEMMEQMRQAQEMMRQYQR